MLTGTGKEADEGFFGIYKTTVDNELDEYEMFISVMNRESPSASALGNSYMVYLPILAVFALLSFSLAPLCFLFCVIALLRFSLVFPGLSGSLYLSFTSLGPPCSALALLGSPFSWGAHPLSPGRRGERTAPGGVPSSRLAAERGTARGAQEGV